MSVFEEELLAACVSLVKAAIHKALQPAMNPVIVYNDVEILCPLLDRYMYLCTSFLFLISENPHANLPHQTPIILVLLCVCISLSQWFLSFVINFRKQLRL